tara:strand:+ start:103 stop:936 length:834 start_codon:yes stop_codon:yes gene_type:complete
MNKVSTSINDDNNVVSNLGEKILTALNTAKIKSSNWTPEVLGPADQIHGGGLKQTKFHASLTTITSEMKLLDMGCGIGGPARYFATEFGCEVLGVDITPEYIDVARMLTKKIGLSDLVAFDCYDVTSLPYESSSFDMIWALNVTMNIEDRDALYQEMHRLLKVGGTIAISELGKGPNGAPYYPLPWARDPSYCFLIEPDIMRSKLQKAGFQVLEWVDETARRKAENKKPQKNSNVISTPLTIEITRGNDYPVRRKNSARSAKEGKLTNVMLIAEKFE